MDDGKRILECFTLDLRDGYFSEAMVPTITSSYNSNSAVYTTVGSLMLYPHTSFVLWMV